MLMSRIKVEEEEKEISIDSIIDKEEDVQSEESFKRWQLGVILFMGMMIGFLIGVLMYG